ncbi:MAG: molybdopterin-binding/glycosyltransferase family 2 protein [Gammaproteobacteria bacterium]|nr:molybdopterin-binding/glycosyltransferase family 2 protein [Gammaproteobacteria bacterium]
MRFGRITVADAAGTVLAHGMRVGSRTFRKGRVLNAADIDLLEREGFETVVGASFDTGDVTEDRAAQTAARALAGADVRVGAPFTGRCNVFAAADGLFLVSASDIDRFNAVDEALTVATLSGPRAVREGEMLATIKVIPFAVPGAVLDRAVACLGPEPAIRVVAFEPMDIGVIQTRLPSTKETVLDKTSRVLRARIEALHGRIVEDARCDHDAGAVARAVGRALDGGAQLVLIVGASAIVDRRDVIPGGVVAAGGEVLHLGMPVDPGNLLLLARCRGRPVLGLPGCARSPALNGLDLVLERFAARLDVTRNDIMAMGVGGLLKETAARSQPRREPRRTRPARAASVSAVVLAAGRSTRMGAVNKLLATIDGRAMVRAVVGELEGASVRPIVVVTGHEADRVEEALAGADVRLVHNSEYREGLSASIRAGLAAVPESTQAAVICLGDMPLVRSKHLDKLVAAFDPAEGREICVPVFEGKRGNPVLFARRFFAEMTAVRGDVGARHLIGEYEEFVCEVAMDDRAVLVDVDSPQALRDLEDQL